MLDLFGPVPGAPRGMYVSRACFNTVKSYMFASTAKNMKKKTSKTADTSARVPTSVVCICGSVNNAGLFIDFFLGRDDYLGHNVTITFMIRG